MQKKLYKDPNKKMVSGVLAGIADYINVDVTIVRIIYVILSFASTVFPGLIVYIILALIMPTKDEVMNSYTNEERQRSAHYQAENKEYQDVNYKDVPPNEENQEKKSYTKSGGSYSSDN